MGLDVYLYRIKDKVLSEANEKQYNDYSDELWGERKYEDIPEKEKDFIRDKLKQKTIELGLNDWGSDITYKEKIEMDSDLHPDHMFKIGYFRSSYNGGGINRVLEKNGAPDLYGIFGLEDMGECRPDYKKALTRVKKAIKKLKDNDDGYGVFTVSGNIFSTTPAVSSESAALEIFRKELKGHSGGMGHYSNINGEFALDNPIQVVGLMPGVENILKKGHPCTYIVYKNENGLTWYVEALEVVQETIEFILAHENPQEFYMYWSG